MRLAYIILIWLFVIFVDTAFATDSDFWNCFFYIKDYIPMALIFYKIATSYISFSDRRMCKIAAIIFIIRCVFELIYIAKIDIIKYLDSCIYIMLLLITLAILGYDKRK